MSDSTSTTNQENVPESEIEIKLIGDKEDCSHCDEGNQFFSKYADDKKIKYTYVNIDSDEGKQYLQSKGIKEGDEYKIPAIKACKIEQVEVDGAKKRVKKCGEVDNFDANTWRSLDNDKLPETVSLSLVDE